MMEELAKVLAGVAGEYEQQIQRYPSSHPEYKLWERRSINKIMKASGADELRAALEACLAFEKEKAGYQGLSDCTCINLSREADRAYENGECPHQKARAALAKYPGEKQ